MYHHTKFDCKTLNTSQEMDQIHLLEADPTLWPWQQKTDLLMMHQSSNEDRSSNDAPIF